VPFTPHRFAVALVALTILLLALPGAVLAEDPPAPEVTTQAATDVTGTTATLHADVVSNGTPTTAHFVYGTTPDRLASRTPDVTVAAGPGSVPISAAIDRLTPGIKYYVMAVAENDDWVVPGDQTSFDTSPPPAILGSMGDVTYKSAALHLHVTTNGQPVTISGAVGFGRLISGVAISGIVLRPVAPIGPVTVATDGDVVIPVAGLAPNTNYDWAVTATNANGKGITGGSFHTEGLIFMPRPRLSRTKVAYGTHVTIAGALPKPGLLVTLTEQTWPFTGVITPLTAITTTADPAGNYAFDVRAEHSARYGVTVDGAAPSSAVNLAKLEVFPAVTAQLKRAKHHRFVVTGRYAPADADKVSLFRRNAGRVATAAADTGRFRFAARALKPGKYEVRVTPAAGSGLTIGKSAAFTVPRR
jgi:hypothetical protein